MFDFMALLNDPAMLEKITNNLAMSPLDPAAAMQQLAQGQGMPQPAGGLPGMQPMPMMPGMDPGQMTNLPMLPGMGAASRIPMGPPGIGFADIVSGEMPTAPGVQIPGNPAQSIGGPGVQLPSAEQMAQTQAEQKQAPGVDLKKVLQGFQGLQQPQQEQQRAPGAPSVPQLRWSPFTAGMLQTPGAGQRMSLAQLLQGRM